MFAEHCVSMAHLGYGFTRWQIIDTAKNMCEVVGNDSEPTKHWFYGFLSRFPDLKMTQPKKREKARDDAVNEEVLHSYFDELGRTLDEYDIKNKPQYIWNVDETGVSLDHNPPKILAKAGSNPHSVTSGKSATTTVIAAVSALGETIPPFIIFKGERMSKEIRSDVIPGTEYRSSPTGWSNSSLFLDFFNNHFMRHVTARPCLLLYDGHFTHVTFDINDSARKENIHLFVLPPHSSHCLQPLDVSVFSPFKKSLSTDCHKFLHSHPNRILVKEDLPYIIGTAFQNSLTVSTIMSGYRKTGIFPFDPSAPVVTPPVIEKEKQELKATRKERKDNRSVKILFQEKSCDFNSLKENVEPKKKKATFIPPYGATITEETFYEKKKSMEEEKKSKQENTELKPKSCKREMVFTPPFSQSEKGLNEIDSKEKEKVKDKTVEKSQNKKLKKVTQVKESNTFETKKKGKGPLSNSTRGKGPAKRKHVVDVAPSSMSQIEECDTECCIVCGKFQPNALNLNLAIRFVDWGCCSSCGKWVHLKFCCDVEKLSDSDDFKCPRCCNEQ